MNARPAPQATADLRPESLLETVPNDGRRLKILISLLYYFPHRTGLTIHVQRVAEELVRRGHQVTVLTARYRSDLPRDDVSMHEGVRIVRLWAPIRLSRGFIMPAYPYAAFKLMREHDVVSIHTPMLETALTALLARLTGRKIVITHHGDLVLPKGSAVNAFIQATMFLMYRVAARWSPQVIAYSQDYADHSYYLRPYLHKTAVNYPPILMPPANPQRVAALRREWSRSGGPVIGFAGRFVEEKRPDLLIKALEVINTKYPNARVVFCGEYDIKYEDTWERHQELVERYRDQLVFLGLREDPQEMADFYAACDVLALTSDTECFALVQVEAMLCGTPVVMTNTEGGRVPVQMTGMGKLAQKGDWRSIGEALVDVLDNPAQYRKTRQFIESVFSFTTTVDNYERFFRANAAPINVTTPRRA